MKNYEKLGLSTSFDKNFKSVSNLKWLPWIGINYNTSKNRILVVGESHYLGNSEGTDGKHSKENFTRIVITELAIQYLTDDKRKATLYRNLNLALIGGVSKDEANRLELWKQFSYYNFIQEPMKDISKRPTKSQVKSGWEVFIEVVRILKPKKVLFIGSKVSANYTKILTELNIEFEKIKVPKKITSKQLHRQMFINVDNKNIELNFIKHTSSFFSWKKWFSYFQQIDFLKV